MVVCLRPAAEEVVVLLEQAEAHQPSAAGVVEEVEAVAQARPAEAVEALLAWPELRPLAAPRVEVVVTTPISAEVVVLPEQAEAHRPSAAAEAAVEEVPLLPPAVTTLVAGMSPLP